jgi:hypothetical protein
MTNTPPPTAPQEANNTAGAGCMARLVRHYLTLDEFIFEQLKSLEDFEVTWRELHRKNAEIYPLEMFTGDWGEQLELWRDRKDSILPNDQAHTPAPLTDPKP